MSVLSLRPLCFGRKARLPLVLLALMLNVITSTKPPGAGIRVWCTAKTRDLHQNANGQGRTPSLQPSLPNPNVTMTVQLVKPMTKEISQNRCLHRVLLPTSSGRQRYNVLGALHAITHEVETLTNTTYFNSERVLTFLQQMVKQCAD